MQLSKRMELLASKVTKGNRLADVGTDHGYIPIALVQRKSIPSSIAMDVNRGPLERAKEHIRAYGLDTYIETRLSDGLAELLPDEADTVLIAGMGGMLTVRILNEGVHCLPSIKELILQPQSEIHLVRKWLFDHEFQIVEEDIVKDEGKYYPVMKAIHGEKEDFCVEEFNYGKIEVQCSPWVLVEYLQKRLVKNKKIMDFLKQGGRTDSLRMKELLNDTDGIYRTIAKIKIYQKEQTYEMR